MKSKSWKFRIFRKNCLVLDCMWPAPRTSGHVQFSKLEWNGITGQYGHMYRVRNWNWHPLLHSFVVEVSSSSAPCTVYIATMNPLSPHKLLGFFHSVADSSSRYLQKVTISRKNSIVENRLFKWIIEKFVKVSSGRKMA